MQSQKSIMRRRQVERIEAMGRKEGRFLLDIEEQVGSCLKWPHQYTEAMLSTHLRFPDRWQLVLFLLGNRCPPLLFTEWFMRRNMLKDKSARDQVADLIRQHLTGSLEQQGRTTWIMDATSTTPVWDRKRKWEGVGDPIEDKNMPIQTPSFAFDWQHEWNWTEAIKLLKEGLQPPPESPVPVRMTTRWTHDSPHTDKAAIVNRFESEKRSASKCFMPIQ